MTQLRAIKILAPDVAEELEELRAFKRRVMDSAREVDEGETARRVRARTRAAAQEEEDKAAQSKSGQESPRYSPGSPAYDPTEQEQDQEQEEEAPAAGGVNPPSSPVYDPEEHDGDSADAPPSTP